MSKKSQSHSAPSLLSTFFHYIHDNFGKYVVLFLVAQSTVAEARQATSYPRPPVRDTLLQWDPSGATLQRHDLLSNTASWLSRQQKFTDPSDNRFSDSLRDNRYIPSKSDRQNWRQADNILHGKLNEPCEIPEKDGPSIGPARP